MTFNTFNKACDYVMDKCQVDNDTAIAVVSDLIDIFDVHPEEDPKEFFEQHADALTALGFTIEEEE